MEQQSEHATTRRRRPAHSIPLRNTAATPPPRFPRQDVRCSPLLGRRLRRPPGHRTPTGSHGPAPTSPPATHGTAGARPPHVNEIHIPRVHRRPERGTPAKGARPRRHAPTAPPPKDIYATLAGTLAPMDAEQYYQSMQRDLPADHATLQGRKQEKRNDNEWGTEEDLLWEDTWKGTMDAFLEAAAETYPRQPGNTRHGLHALLAFHSWKHRHTITLHPLDHNPHRWTPEDDAIAAITIQQNSENPVEYHITWNDPAPHLPAPPHPPRRLRYHQEAGSESLTTNGRRHAPGTISTNHTGKPPHRAPHPPHHHNGAPPTAPHHPGPQRVSEPATGLGSPQRHTPMRQNHTGAPGHPPPLDHRAHHHLDTTNGPPPPPPHRPTGCHHHTN